MAPARVVHFEIPSDDGDRARDFYSQVFEWSLQPMLELEYTGISTGPAGEDGMPSEPGYIGGGMGKREGTFASPTVVMAVDDIDATLKVIEAHWWRDGVAQGGGRKHGLRGLLHRSRREHARALTERHLSRLTARRFESLT